MRIFRSASSPTSPADPATFVGSVTVERLAKDDTGLPVGLYRVTFNDGGRSHWHSHSGPQWLFIVEGRIRVQRQGEAAHSPLAKNTGTAPCRAREARTWR